jgi:REP element-mobilizing transposase RayT
LDFPGAIHHVMNRGARREPVFVSDEANALFLGLLEVIAKKYAIVIHGYALMPNHYHLLIQAPRGNLAAPMRHLIANFTKRLNAMHAWDGPVFRGRYKSCVVPDEAYFLHLLAYLHLNPVRAHLVPDVDAAQWTSHAAYCGRRVRPEWLTTSTLLAGFGSVDAYRTYVDDVRLKCREPPASFAADDLWRRTHFESAWLPPRPAPTGDDVIERVVRITGVSADKLRRDSHESRPARWLTARLLVEAGVTLAKAGSYLGIGVAGAGRMSRRVAEHRSTAPIDGWLMTIEAEDAEMDQDPG